MRPWWRWVVLLVLVLGVAAGWSAWTWRALRRDESRLAGARAAMDQGRWGAARATLMELLERRPGWDEAAYELGICELARGRDRAAAEAWDRIPEGSPRTGWVELRRSKLAMNEGRLDECERLLRSAAARPGTQRAEARWGLVILLRLEGRFFEARRWLEDGFAEMTDPVETLQRLYRLDHDLFPAEGVRQALEKAGAQAPEDDRVWLGQAHLAIRLGKLEEARNWLDRCRARRPDDVPVWRMRLEWAIAADRPDDVRECLPHLPAVLEPPTRVPALRAFFAAQRDERAVEREALRQQLAADPANLQVLQRLAELEQAAGYSKEAAELRQHKLEIEDARKQYERLLFGPDPAANAEMLATVAGRLGRGFDAGRWARLAGHPDANDGASGSGKAPSEPTGTLADLLPEIVGERVVPVASPSANEAPSLAFEDDAAGVGLQFVQANGGEKGRLIPPVTSSGGVGLLDFNNDGWLDVYAVQAGSFPPDPSGTFSGDRLFRNRGGTFEDVTDSSGITSMTRGYGHGVAVGDIDNDGFPDLFVTRWRSYALYRNRRDGTFEDVTERAGLGGDRDWPTSAAFADLDGDGDLDLYVCHYMKWDEKDKRTCADPDDPTIYNCSPLDFESLPDHLFRNDGGRFVDVTAEAGIQDRNGRGLGVVAADLDGDGKIDLYVANDMSANYLFRNLGGLRFEEVALASGVASNASGGFQAGMGVACGDLDGDGLADLTVANFYNESTSFFRNLGQGLFAESSVPIGMAGPSRYLLGFGIIFLDADNDGWLDVMTANGHVHDGRPQYPWKMPVQLLHNRGGPRLRMEDRSGSAGAPFQVLRMGRGLASGDLDNDGRVDAVLIGQDEPLAYFHNRSGPHHFLTIRLEGKESGRDAVGARAIVRAGGRERAAWRFGGGSYQSASDPRLHFGLESLTRIDEVEVRWSSGRVDRYSDLPVDTGYLLREGESKPLPLDGWKPRR